MNWFDGPDMKALYEALRKLAKLGDVEGWAAEHLKSADKATRERKWKRAFEQLVLATRSAAYDRGAANARGSTDYDKYERIQRYGDPSGNGATKGMSSGRRNDE